VILYSESSSELTFENSFESTESLCSELSSEVTFQNFVFKELVNNASDTGSQASMLMLLQVYAVMGWLRLVGSIKL